ncbi:MAG TPA: polysaccharide pyruvyl transferase family protein [Bacteroidales bacterium]|nr:polysaccharide pyruvyl transferase family protein [Bacteroidales bacterium]
MLKYLRYIKNRFKNTLLTLRGERNKVELFYWNTDYDNKDNFGDVLSKIIVRKVAEKFNITNFNDKFNKLEFFADSKQLLPIGSILHAAKENAIVWGSGINGKVRKTIRVKNLDVRMVRGPLTRMVLLENGINCPSIYGDPALLVSDFFNYKLTGKKNEYIIIPNLNDLIFYKGIDNVISPLDDWDIIIQEIAQSKLVVSSSLHGIIVAESFGVPARHVLSYFEPVFKYIDYYRGTGRKKYKFAQSIDDALRMGGEILPDVEELKKNMYDTFPIDIWM